MRCRAVAHAAQLGVVGALASLACADAERAERESRTTAAADTLIESDAPTLPPDRAWRVETAPVLTIGAGDSRASAGDTVYEFHEINGAKLLGDGRIVVAVMGSHALRFFDDEGAYLGAAGRYGDGPGEFRQIMGLFRIRGDTLVVSDNLVELDWFSGRGESVPTRRRPRDEAAFNSSVAVLDNGTAFELEFSRHEAQGRHRRRILRVMRVDRRSGRTDSVAAVPGILNAGVAPGRLGENTVAFSPRPHFVTIGDTLVIGSSDRPELELRDPAGGLLRRIRWVLPAMPVSAALKRDWKEHYLHRNDEQGVAFTTAWRRQQQPFLDSDPFPDSLPSILAIVASREGELWVQRYDARSVFRQTWSVGTQSLDVPAVWDVLARDGRWLTTVELPARFSLLDVAGDRLLGLIQNDDEEQGIRVLKLVKP